MPRPARYVEVKRHNGGTHLVACRVCPWIAYVATWSGSRTAPEDDARRHARACKAIAIAHERDRWRDLYRDELDRRIAWVGRANRAATRWLDLALAIRAAHPCPTARTTGEDCDTACIRCEGRGWV